MSDENDATVGRDLPCPSDQKQYDEYKRYAEEADEK